MDDLPRVAPLRRRALDTLRPPAEAPVGGARDDVAPELLHLLRTDPDLAWIAEGVGGPLGYALGAVRDGLCTVSHLFVDPEAHERDIGQELLRRLLAAADSRGAARRWVVASSSLAAHALYLRAGMYDRATLYPLQGPVRALLTLPEPPSQARVKRPTLCDGWLHRLNALDRTVRGAARPEDHAFFLESPDAHCEAFADEAGDLSGYVYYWDDGHIGPAAATEPELVPSLLRIAGSALDRSGVDAVTLLVPSLSTVALSALMERRFVIRRLNTLMSSAVWGALDRYLPSGGVLM
ncbi:MAG TPA: GNAT family N-acetyltransferase [Candidatus Tectomicrobia bacterium]|nr:GNAT family N-acetyltransferase [Candidatus Tectomicrobia bacterium]